VGRLRVKIVAVGPDGKEVRDRVRSDLVPQVVEEMGAVGYVNIRTFWPTKEPRPRAAVRRVARVA